jgi:hypothetical protein
LKLARFKAFCKTGIKRDMKVLFVNSLGLKDQKVKKLAKVPRQMADNPHREALINRNLLSAASLNS